MATLENQPQLYVVQPDSENLAHGSEGALNQTSDLSVLNELTVPKLPGTQTASVQAVDITLNDQALILDAGNACFPTQLNEILPETLLSAQVNASAVQSMLESLDHVADSTTNQPTLSKDEAAILANATIEMLGDPVV